MNIHFLKDTEANTQILDIVPNSIHVVNLCLLLDILLLLLLRHATYASVVPYLEVPAAVLLSRIPISRWDNEIINDDNLLLIFLIH